ncbi:MAG: DUF3391 domain-containing protein [Reinekea sp.]|nr:DUF3391 domain-containing protein [Reinekea sp.]MDX1473712.1 DUF3391 domain-containing protein [Reinekea sp.]
MKKSFYIPMNQLRVGLFVDLELSWTEHPFLFSKFKIKQQDEIAQIRKLGLQKILVVIKKSTPEALRQISDQPIESDEFAIEPDPAGDDTQDNSDLDTLWTQKKQSLDKAEEYRKERRKTAQRYRETQKRVSNLVRNLRLAPANAIRDADEVIGDISSLLASQTNIVVSMVSLEAGEFNLQNHALNVTVLAMMLAKSLDVSAEDMHHLGVACILHDIGKIVLPQGIVHKVGMLNAVEQDVMKTHVNKGLALLSRVKNIEPVALEMIADHHVYLDGSGYPAAPRHGELSELSRILQVANHYDSMCNPNDPKLAVSPKIAMAKLFSNYEGKLDSYYIHQFVRNFGVYPPGCVVKLSDDSIALVSSVDSDNLLAPTVIVYNPDIPANQALMLNLADHEELSIVQALKPGEYSPELNAYLGLEDRLGFFFGSPKN